MSKKEVTDFLVVENSPLNHSNFLIKIKSVNNLPQLFPGQFVNIEIPEEKEIFLRRPFSIFEVDYDNNSISLIIKILGKGSKRLTEINPGKILNVILPLGKGFSLPEKTDNVLMVGGGSGMAPLLFLAKNSGLKKNQVHILIGARSQTDHIELNNYSEYGNFYYTTEDGTFGEKGFVTQHSVFVQSLSGFTRIYACGPLGMMKAVAAEAKLKNIFCEVSLENLMACGFGVCLCCIEPTVNGNLCVCTEGPVFNINDLKW